MPNPGKTALAFGGALVALLAGAPGAQAGTIRYTIPSSPAYSVQDNGNGIVKVTYNGCVTAGERQVLDFALSTVVTNDATATFNVLKEEGGDPTTTFTPATVTLTKGQEQPYSASLAFTLPGANNGVTTFRIKLDPETGEGLGQGAGIMVSIPCVLAAPPESGGFATAPTPEGGTAIVPTAGVLGSVASGAARGVARCVATPQRMRVRAGERTRLRVRVATNGSNIAGALVRVTLPGGRAITRRTDAAGFATFVLRPRRRGRLVVQSDVCFGARRIAVLSQNVAARRAPARFTG